MILWLHPAVFGVGRSRILQFALLASTSTAGGEFWDCAFDTLDVQHAALQWHSMKLVLWPWHLVLCFGTLLGAVLPAHTPLSTHAMPRLRLHHLSAAGFTLNQGIVCLHHLV